MPLTYQLDIRLRLVMTRGSGTVTLEDIWSHRRRLADDSRVTAGFAELTDLCDIEAMRLTSAELNQVVSQDQSPQGFDTSPLAFVSGKPAVYGVMRMYSMLTERAGRRVGVFGTIDEALAWIERTRGLANGEEDH